MQQLFEDMMAESALAVARNFLEEERACVLGVAQDFDHVLAIGDQSLLYSPHGFSIDPRVKPGPKSLAQSLEELDPNTLPTGRKLWVLSFNITPYIHNVAMVLAQKLNPGDGVCFSTWRPSSPMRDHYRHSLKSQPLPLLDPDLEPIFQRLQLPRRWSIDHIDSQQTFGILDAASRL